jgi:hypothetical protein
MPVYDVTMIVTLTLTETVNADSEEDAAFEAEDQLELDWNEVDSVEVVAVKQERPSTPAQLAAALAARDAVRDGKS